MSLFFSMKSSIRWHQMHHSPPTSSIILRFETFASSTAFSKSFEGFLAGSNYVTEVYFEPDCAEDNPDKTTEKIIISIALIITYPFQIAYMFFIIEIA